MGLFRSFRGEIMILRRLEEDWQIEGVMLEKLNWAEQHSIINDKEA